MKNNKIDFKTAKVCLGFIYKFGYETKRINPIYSQLTFAV